MAWQIKKAKQVQEKSRSHAVKHIDGYQYQVTSGSSKKVYTVHYSPNGYSTCTCDWGKYRPSRAGQCGCSHVIAVAQHVEAQKTPKAKVYAWASERAANRQKKHKLYLGDGVVLTVTK